MHRPSYCSLLLPEDNSLQKLRAKHSIISSTCRALEFMPLLFLILCGIIFFWKINSKCIMQAACGLPNLILHTWSRSVLTEMGEKGKGLLLPKCRVGSCLELFFFLVATRVGWETNRCCGAYEYVLQCGILESGSFN